MADLLLELLCEEIPARMQARACEDLKKLVGDAFAAQALAFDILEAFATPRRLVLHVTGLPMAQADMNEELKGPRTDAPDAALAGFLKKTGLTKEQLEIRDDGKKGQVYFAVISRTGRATADVIADIVPDVVRKFPWPKSMRWGAASLKTDSLRWVRPLQSIICLLNNNVVPFEIDGIKSSNITRGHRFMSMSQFTVESFEDYRTKLRMSKVILDPAERMKKIDADARALAAGAGLALVEDAGLLAENAGLTEWPVVLLGEFDASYLDVPAECLTATMRANQKYFSLRDADGKLANRFLCTANLDAKDGGKMIVAGNQKVLSARLSDAKFFWDQDRKKELEEYLPKLGDIVFHEKLGTVADKVTRVEKLAEHLARQLYPQFVSSKTIVTPAQAGVHASTGAPLAAMDTGLRRYDDVELFVKDVRRAAKLCKADLVTGMVGEFPELQGIMGRYYATAQGENPDVALAIEEHYKPQGLNDTVPANPVSICVALADKLHDLFLFFYAKEFPTGSKDPFALRRAALDIIRIVLASKIRLNIFAVRNAVAAAANMDTYNLPDIDHFVFDRLAAFLKNEGIAGDMIAAVRERPEARMSGGSYDSDVWRVTLVARTIKEFLETDDGTNLLAGYRRAANILEIEEEKDGEFYILTSTEGYIGETEKNLAALFADGLKAQMESMIAAENFDVAMGKLATLRAPVDAFFAEVMVNDPDPAVRVRRLKLLAGVRDVMHKVADFSKIEG